MTQTLTQQERRFETLSLIRRDIYNNRGTYESIFGTDRYFAAIYLHDNHALVIDSDDDVSRLIRRVEVREKSGCDNMDRSKVVLISNLAQIVSSVEERQ